MLERLKAWFYVMFREPIGIRCKVCTPWCPYVLNCEADFVIEKCLESREKEILKNGNKIY